MLRLIVNWILRFGIIELFSIFFVMINGAALFLYVSYSRKEKNNKWSIHAAALALFTLVCGGIGAFLGMCFVRQRPRRHKLIVFIGLVVALIPMIHIVNGLTLSRIVRYVEIEFISEAWPLELDGYRIAFFADTHVISHENMGNIAAELNNRNIDLLILGGDFSTRDAHYQGTIREIAEIVTTDGIFGVEGNHDNHIMLFRAMEEHGMTPLDNSGVHIREKFFLAGVHDMWNRSPDIEAAMAGANADDFVLLISHNPDVTMEQSTLGIDLVLSGHTHGGQIAFFGFPMYLLRGSITDYGTTFGYGFAYSADGVPVFVTRGVGVYYTIPRIFARPEVVIFTMRSY